MRIRYLSSLVAYERRREASYRPACPQARRTSSAGATRRAARRRSRASSRACPSRPSATARATASTAATSGTSATTVTAAFFYVVVFIRGLRDDLPRSLSGSAVTAAQCAELGCEMGCRPTHGGLACYCARGYEPLHGKCVGETCRSGAHAPVRGPEALVRIGQSPHRSRPQIATSACARTRARSSAATRPAPSSARAPTGTRCVPTTAPARPRTVSIAPRPAERSAPR